MGAILVIKLGALGDFIQALGPMKAIRAAHPQDRITLLTTKPFEKLGRECGYFDDIVIDRRPKWHDLTGWIALRRVLNDGQFSRVYDLQNNDRTSFYLKLFNPKPEWVGAAAGASHRNASPERTSGKAFQGHVQTLGLAGIKNVEVDNLSWMKGRHDYPGLVTPYVLVVPGASPKHPQKRWHSRSYADFCRKLVERKFQPVLIGGEAEKAILADIAYAVPETLNLCGQTNLADIASLARLAFGAVGNDTGPMHMIAPTGCPTIVLFSASSNPQRHGPLGQDVLSLQKNNLEDLKAGDVWKAFCDQHAMTP